VKLSSLFAGLILTTPLAAQAGQSQTELFVEVPGIQEFSGMLIVRPLQMDALLAQGMSESEARQTRRAAQERLFGLVRNQIEVNDEYIINMPEGMDENTMAGQLMASGLYEYAEPNWFLYPLDTTPNDPSFGGQWWHQNIRSEAGWDYGTGSTNTIAAVCDTGIDSDHPDLAARLLPGYNSVDELTEAQGGNVEDINGHGTLCAGCVGAIGNNNNQVVGVNWEVSILPVRVSNSSSGGAYLDDLTGGALWAAQNGAGSASVSYSGVNSNSVGTTGTTMKNSYDSLLFWAAGNGNSQISGFDHTNTIVCAATDQNDNRASFSNYGALIDVAAPGVSVLTTSNGGGIASVSGTSFSTPISNGLAALLRSTNPGLSAQDVEDLIFDNAQNIGSSNFFGNGLIDVEASMMNAGGGGGYDLDLIVDPLVAGTLGTATITGSTWTTRVYLYNGNGMGTTTTPYGTDLEISNGNSVASDVANFTGTADITKTLPNALSGRTVYLQAIDENGLISQVVVDTIL